MKRRIFLLVIPILLTVVSCDDFTILAPISERNVENFYQTETDFQVAINGAYQALAARDAYGRDYVLLTEMRADNTNHGGGDTGLAEEFFRLNTFTELPTTGTIESAWAGGYQGIARTNTILSRLGNVTLPNPALQSRIEGEALFIRSLFYYNLAIIYGNIPLQLEEVTSPEIQINQVSADIIYEQIAGDLETAQGLLPQNYTEPENLGRATSGAANALLGLVHLTLGNNAQAETALRRVVDSGQYNLLPNYADLWGPNVANTIETVFEIQYRSGGTGTGSSFTEFYTPFGLAAGVGGGNAPQVIAGDFIENTFEEGDARFWGGTLDSTDTGAVYSKKFESQPTSQFDADNNFPVFRYADVLLMLAEAIGESPEAYNLINRVRERANVAPISAATPGTFEQKLFHERKMEFAHENKRWADLKRWGEGVTRQVMANFHGIAPSDVRMLHLIPQREIDVAPDQMQQNPQ